MDPTLALESRPLNTTNNRLFLPDIRSRVLTSFVYFIHISSVQFSRSISIAQLSRMSHCAPEATLNPIRLKFTPETVVSNVFVEQVCWEAVPNTWPGNSKASVAKCVVCAWNGARSVGGRVKPASKTFRDQVYVVGQVRRCLAGQRGEDKAYASLKSTRL